MEVCNMPNVPRQSGARNSRRAPERKIAIYSGRACLGHVLENDTDGFVALAPSGSSIGTYPTQRAAIDAIMRVVR
jgi:hypothetical protein